MKSFWGVLLGLSLLVFCSVATKADEISTAIEKLGDQDLVVRNAASAKLRELGERATAPLIQATKHTDPEVATRARELLTEFFSQPPLGNNPRLTRAIHQTTSPRGTERATGVHYLANNGHFERALWLTELEQEGGIKQLMRNSLKLARDAEFMRHLVAGDFARAGALLTNLTDGQHAQHMAMYWYLAGEAPAQIAKLQADAALDPKSERGTQLWYLLRLTNDYKPLRAWTARREDRDEIATVAWSTLDWPKLVELVGRRTPRYIYDEMWLANFWGRMLAIHRAGSLPTLSQVEEGLNRLILSVDDTTAAEVAETWLLFGELDKAMELLQKRDRHSLAELHMLRGNFRAAFELLGLPPAAPASRAATWLNGLDLNDEYLDISFAMHPVNRGLLAARALHQVGETRAATDLMSKTAHAFKEHESFYDSALRRTYEAEFELEIGESAERHYVEYFEYQNKVNEPQAGMTTIYQTKLPHPRADTWFYGMLRADKSLPPRDAIRRTRQLLFPEYRPALNDSEWETLLRAQLPPADQAVPEFNAILIADAFLTRGKVEPAIAILKRSLEHSAPSDETPAAWRLIRLYIDEGRLDDALDLANEYVQRSPRQPLNWWLLARVHELQKDLPANARASDIARKLSIISGDNQSRCETLQEWGLEQAAASEWELWSKTGEYKGLRSIGAHRFLEKKYGLNHPSKALQQWYLVRAWHLERNARVTLQQVLPEGQSYWAYRAAEHHQAGQAQQAAEAWLKALAVIPHDVDFVIRSVRHLRSINDPSNANALFEQAYQTLKSLCSDYKQSHYFHGELARLCAYCERKLDDGLKHGQIAVELAPDHARYLSTLAEVNFCRGDHTQAISLAERSAALNPSLEQVREQLRRFAAANRK